ncbi:hypothetical protein [Adhaeribacter radiodurans]|nr:hypothetical protein [Adhaeribacter radiodurans]
MISSSKSEGRVAKVGSAVMVVRPGDLTFASMAKVAVLASVSAS